ncbi:hypothetical protein FQA39_LY05483 [Lamprigera yunnana]|nr:hypothetical protein FQA39_LY05483 [Lamprigera yunnana]
MAPGYKVTYFAVKALAEPIRFLLSYGGIEFEDLRIEFEEWPQLKNKMPFGQVPVLEVDGKQAYQSVAICRYLAKKVKLNGSDDWEDLQIDAIVDTINDFRGKLALYHYEKDEIIKEKRKALLYDETLPYYLERLEQLAKTNKGHLVGGKLTWADVYFVGLLDYLNVMVGKDLTAGCPNLQQLRENVKLTNMAPAYKLTYFPIRGIAEPLRFLLSYGGIEFEDVRFEFEEWPQLKNKMPFGQVPILEVDGKQAYQSVAICRYLAKEVKLNGADDWENLQIDAVVDTINDLNRKLSLWNYESDEIIKEDLKRVLFVETLPYYFDRFEKMAEVNNGYFVGGKLTWADFYFVGILESLYVMFGKEVIKGYPNLQQLHENVVSLPAIKDWIEKRPLTWADFYFVGLLDFLVVMAGKEVIKDYPNVQQLHKNVVSLPAIKD